jgi:aspartyl-tRNA(Asn)/glutamyl-tRNA(Gln) amidotransferase subunit A
MPALSMPCGADAAGLPIGLQFTAPVLAEATLFRAAHALEADLALELRPSL